MAQSNNVIQHPNKISLRAIERARKKALKKDPLYRPARQINKTGAGFLSIAATGLFLLTSQALPEIEAQFEYASRPNAPKQHLTHAYAFAAASAASGLLCLGVGVLGAAKIRESWAAPVFKR